MVNRHPRFSLSSAVRRGSRNRLVWWLKKSGTFTKRRIRWEELPQDPNNLGPSRAVVKDFSLQDGQVKKKSRK